MLSCLGKRLRLIDYCRAATGEVKFVSLKGKAVMATKALKLKSCLNWIISQFHKRSHLWSEKYTLLEERNELKTLFQLKSESNLIYHCDIVSLKVKSVLRISLLYC